MYFDEQLNSYIEQLNCTSKELADKSNLSAPVISRFRNGKRIPNLKTLQLDHLSNGLFTLAKEKGINLTKETIYSTLLSTLDDNINMEQLRENFNNIVTTLKINTTSLANSIGFSPSLISKIRTGKRNPYKPQLLANGICRYVVNNFKTATEKETIALLLKCPLKDLDDATNYYNKLLNWLCVKSTPINTSIDNFLNNLDEFNLDEYIKAIHFDEMKIPHIPFYKAPSSTYYGIEEMKKGELEFFKATVLSKSNDPIFMCSDMPMEDMAEDKEFGKKWMYAIAMSLKKGLKLNIIHNINRSFNEMILGLESWIPIYMTGQVSPYYLKDFQDNTYCHLNYVSGTVYLSGECIKEHHNDGKYTLSSNTTELKYYSNKAKFLLDKAVPLMDIYNVDKKIEFNNFISSDTNVIGKRRRILSTLPIHTISEELVLKILKNNKIPNQKVTEILETIAEEKERVKTILKNNVFIDEMEEISKEEFDKSPNILFLANSFYTDKVYYDYEDYLEHLKLSKEYSNEHKNYKLELTKNHTFKNIQIYINEKNYVMISKNTSPAIHFVIKHPKLRTVIENFIPPIIE